MWLTQIEMDLAWKRNEEIFADFYVCVHVNVCENTRPEVSSGVFTDCSPPYHLSLSLELPNSAIVPAQRAPPGGQGANSGTQA